MTNALPRPPRIPCREQAVAGAGVAGVHIAPGGAPHANEETPRPGAAPGAEVAQPGLTPARVTDRARQQQCQALSHREGPYLPVEARCPRSGDEALLCPAQLSGTPHTLATND